VDFRNHLKACATSVGKINQDDVGRKSKQSRRDPVQFGDPFRLESQSLCDLHAGRSGRVVCIDNQDMKGGQVGRDLMLCIHGL
jgi:hypothetical protein